jgi:hypothetical protein
VNLTCGILATLPGPSAGPFSVSIFDKTGNLSGEKMHWKEQLSCDFYLGFVASEDASRSLDVRQLN